jgi:glycosyltransferase involved in cell wall biosynthesis
VKVSVVIPTARFPSEIESVVEKILQQNYAPFEILVVDNSQERDHSFHIKKIAEKFENRKVRYIREEQEGLHNARNRGLLESKGEIVLFQDDDALPGDENLIREIVSSFTKNGNAGAVGGKVLPIFEAELPEFFKYLKHSYLSLCDWGDEEKEVDFLNGNNFAVDRETAILVGGFNPDLFISKNKIWLRGDGESGLCIKIRQMGKKIIYNPKAVVYHKISRKRMSLRYLKERAFKHGIQMSYSKFHWGDFPKRPVLALRSFCFLSLHIIYNLLALLDKSKKERYAVESAVMKARFLYEMKLIYDKKLREHVKKKDWISELKNLKRKSSNAF